MSCSKDPRIRWITSSSEIRSLRREGRLSRGNLVFIWVSGAGHPAGEVQVAVATGRGFSGSVGRNKAKRRVKGSVLQLRSLLEPGRSYLLEGRKELESADYQELVSEIEETITRTRNWATKK